MSLGCAASACGDCCDPVGLSAPVQAVIERFAYSLESGFIGPIQDIDPSIPFALEHWHPYEGPAPEISEGHRLYLCDRFNTETRLCEAYDDRPPVCSKFPFSGGTLTTERLYDRCSYWLDVPAAERPASARPLIPISVKVH